MPRPGSTTRTTTLSNPNRRRIDVENLLHWTFAIQKAGAIVGAGVGLQKTEAIVDGVGEDSWGSSDSYERIKHNAKLGTFIDGGGPSRGDLDPDAEAVLFALAELNAESQWILQKHARTGTRPNWIPGGTRCLPVLNWNGKPSKGYDDNRNAIFCYIQIRHPPESIRLARRLYCRWYIGLVVLADVFSRPGRELQNISALGPSAPAFPWID